MQRMQRGSERCGVCVCVCFILYPLLFIAGSHQPQHPKPTLWANREAPRALVEAVGPTGLAGRPGRSVDLLGPPTAPNFLEWACLDLPCPKVEAWPAPAGFASVLGLHLVHLSLNRYSDIFCDFVSGHSVLVTCILAWKHNLHILKGKMWFRNFIG